MQRVNDHTPAEQIRPPLTPSMFYACCSDHYSMWMVDCDSYFQLLQLHFTQCVYDARCATRSTELFTDILIISYGKMNKLIRTDSWANGEFLNQPLLITKPKYRRGCVINGSYWCRYVGRKQRPPEHSLRGSRRMRASSSCLVSQAAVRPSRLAPPAGSSGGA